VDEKNDGFQVWSKLGLHNNSTVVLVAEVVNTSE
jgi:hypothetical protein